jgi:hypothetical protein
VSPCRVYCCAYTDALRKEGVGNPNYTHVSGLPLTTALMPMISAEPLTVESDTDDELPSIIVAPANEGTEINTYSFISL